MTEYTIERVNQIYDGNDGEATKTMYEALKAIGPVGEIACNVFRAEKNSQRAKGYRSRRSTGKAYDTKGWAISNLCDLLTRHYVEHGIEWGWGVDSKMAAEDPHRHVLYVQTPFGPCSFHSDYRGKGPDWPHEWDGLIGASRLDGHQHDVGRADRVGIDRKAHHSRAVGRCHRRGVEWQVHGHSRRHGAGAFTAAGQRHWHHGRI